MSTEPTPRQTFLEFLKEQIRQRETLLNEVEKSIQVLREAERELGRHLPGRASPDESAEDLSSPPEAPSTPPAEETLASGATPGSTPPEGDGSSAWQEAEAAGGGADRLAPLGQPLPKTPAKEREAPEEWAAPPHKGEPFEQPRPSAKPEPQEVSYQRQVDELLQEDQMLLLGVEDVTAPPKSPEAASEAARQKEPLLAPAPEPLEAPPPPRAGQAGKEASSSLQRLMDYIRSGGAIRCTDPWGQTCAAFVLRPKGPSVFATDVFLNYVRNVLRGLRPVHQKNASGGPPRELESRVQFLAALTGAIQGQRTANLGSVAGLRMSGREKLPPVFEFENATGEMMHSRAVEMLNSLFRDPPSSFFSPGGSYSELAEYLSRYQEFTRRNGEEQRAAALLTQLGLEPGPKPAGPAQPPSPPPAADPGFFTSEGEEFQDLNTFDFSPEDQKSILAQKEDPLSRSGIKRIAQDSRQAEGEAERPPAPPASPAPGNPPKGSREDAKSLEKFLKDLGVRWKD